MPQHSRSVRVAKTFFTILAAFFLCGSCVGVYFVPDRKMVPVDFMGVIDEINDTQERSRYLSDLGVAWVRADFRWTWVESKQGHWNFQQFDDYIKNSAEAGRKVLGILDYETEWIYPEGKTRSYIPPDKVPFFLNYVRALAERYRGKIGAWEIWNEPNNPFFWEGPLEEFFSLSKLTAQAIREIDPDVPIAAGSTWGVPLSWLEGMHRMGAFDLANVVSFHPYGTDENNSLFFMDQGQVFMNRLGFRGEYWITEIGYPSGGWYPSHTTEDEQAARLVRFYTSAASQGIARVFWYRLLQDHVPAGNYNSEGFFGLAYRDYQEKPAAAAFRTVAHIIPGSFYSPEAATIEGIRRDDIVCLPFVKDSKLFLFVWAKGSEKYHVSVGDRYGHDFSREIVAAGPAGSDLVDRRPQLLTFDYLPGEQVALNVSIVQK